MKQRSLRVTKKRTLVVLGIIMALGLLLAAYMKYTSLSHPDKTSELSTEVKAEVHNLNVVGDTDISGRYIAEIKGENPDQAQNVFDTAVQQAKDNKAKLALLSQNVSLALAYGRTDDALRVALKSVEVEPSYKTYNDVYRVYAVRRDVAKQQEYLEKALASVESSDMTDKEQIRAVVIQQLEMIKQQAAPVGKAG